jgi:CPA2 family monovalent cation:H+ antiporter-2
MESWHILLDILVLLTAALVLGTLAEQLRVSSILGYLVAGTVVGPNVIGLVRSTGNVELIAELGVALLLFTIGLEFSLRRLRRLGRVALVGGTLQVVITAAAGAIGCAVLGLSPRASLALGAMLALSSTACVVRMLVDRAALESVYGRNALAILLLQDAAVIPLMVLLVTLNQGSSPAAAAMALLRTGAAVVVLIGAFYLLFNVLVPRLMNIKRWSSNRELPILLAMVVALGSAAAAHRAGLSPAMGAFVAGLLMGESPFSVQVRADVASLRALLVTLFFASIGLLGDPIWALTHAHWVAGAVILTVTVKTVIVWGIGRMMGLGHGVSLATGLCVAQVGEFSFVLAGIAKGPQGQAGIIDDQTFRLVISTTIATLFLTPFLVAFAPRCAGWLERLTRGPAMPTADGTPVDEGAPQPRALIIGFGPAGQSLAEALMGQHATQLTVVDLNPRNAAVAQRYGLPVHMGDATHREVLEHAGIHRAAVVVLTVPDPATARHVIHQCRHLAPETPILVRARYHIHRWDLQLAGAAVIIDEEEQVGLRLAAEARRHLHGPAGGEAAYP